MSYRKLTHRGKTYEYVIGSKFTKVKLDGKEFEVYENRLYGNEVVSPQNRFDGDTAVYHSGKFIVTPKTVTRMIDGRVPESFGTGKDKTTYLMVNPYASEIEGKVEYIPYNLDSYFNLRDEI